MFTKLDKHASAHQARLLFLKIDDNGGGTVSLGELIPVVFNRASARQVSAPPYLGPYLAPI